MKRTVTVLGIALMTALPIASAIGQQPAPTTAPSQQPAPTTAPSQQAVLVGSDSLVGGAVRDSSGRDIGKVSRLMIDPADGRIASLVISTGGTMGVGSNTISIPWTAVKVGQDRGKVIVTANQMLDTAPGTPPAESRTPPAESRKQ